MIKLYTAFTKEIDNSQKAVEEIIEQLNPEKNKLKNTIGIIYFYYEFVETGTYQAIVDAMPFEVVGCLSSYVEASGQYGDVALSVTMITGDDVHFSVRTLDDPEAKTHEQIVDEVTQICKDFCVQGKPKLVMPFMTLQQNFSGDSLAATVNALPESFPLFGTISFNMENTTGPHFVSGNGKISSNMHVFVAFYGDFEPKFRVTSSFVFDDSFGDSVEITEAEDTVLKKVNGIPALQHLKRQGMITSDNIVTGAYGIWAIPAILTFPDGTRVVRSFVGVVEGTEHIHSTGEMSVGAKIKFANLDGEKTLASATKLFKELCDTKENGVIAYSCAARAWSLGTKFSGEMQKVAECVNEFNPSMNYSLTYSGGEICPVIDNSGKLVNVLHNCTLVSCVLC